MSELQLGSTIDHHGQKARVVRIIAHSQGLFEGADDGDPEYILDESYAELKLEDGMVDFIVFSSTKLPYEGPPSVIAAPEHIPWRADR